MSVEVDVIDNCFLWPMTNMEVELAFEQRIATIRSRTTEYRTDEKNGDDTTLPLTWPLSVFSNPEEPRAIYVAKHSLEERSFLGFLEAKMHARDYAKIVSCVVLSPARHRNGVYAIDVTKKMFDALVEDCVAMDIPTITIPRNWSDYTTNEKYASARYNFNTDDIAQRRAHTTAICSALCQHYPYLVFKTPFKMQYIIVTHESARFLDRFVELFLNGPRNRTFDVYRTYHVSLWRVEHNHQNKHLSQMEVDIVVAWQRKQIAHQALELERETGRPVRIFGKKIVLAPEDPDRLVIVGARRRIDIPPEAVRAENHLWQDALTTIVDHRPREATVDYFSQVNMDDTKARESRKNAQQQETKQIEGLQTRIAAQQRRADRERSVRRRRRGRRLPSLTRRTAVPSSPNAVSPNVEYDPSNLYNDDFWSNSPPSNEVQESSFSLGFGQLDPRVGELGEGMLNAPAEVRHRVDVEATRNASAVVAQETGARYPSLFPQQTGAQYASLFVPQENDTSNEEFDWDLPNLYVSDLGLGD